MYEFQYLPFGLSSAPRVFTKLLKPVTALLRQRGLHLILYHVADGSVQSRIEDISEVSPTAPAVVGVQNELGQICSLQDSIPRVHGELSGDVHVATNGESGQNQSGLQGQLRQPSTTVQELSRMIGHLTATVQAILPAPLCYRQLQRLKNKTFRTSHSYSTKVILEPGARQDQQWWKDHLNKWNGKAVLHQPPDMFMETDASLLGWGA